MEVGRDDEDDDDDRERERNNLMQEMRYVSLVSYFHQPFYMH